MNRKLKDMGYLAHLVMHLLKLAGPLTYDQMCRWLNPGDSGLALTLDRLASKGLIYKGEADLWFLKVERPKKKSSSRNQRDVDELAKIIAEVLVEHGYVRKPF